MWIYSVPVEASCPKPAYRHRRQIPSLPGQWGWKGAFMVVRKNALESECSYIHESARNDRITDIYSEREREKGTYTQERTER